MLTLLTRQAVQLKYPGIDIATMEEVRKVSVEERLLQHIVKNAQEGNPKDVLEKIDQFCSTNWMMNIGDVKGNYLLETIQKHKPLVAVELGAYCGYSTVLIANALPAEGRLYSIELDPLRAAIATKTVEWAGLSHKVKVIIGTAETRLEHLRTHLNVHKIDLLFLDHVKNLYLSDYLRFENAGLLQQGSVVFGDNIIFPGCPDFRKHMEESALYETKLIETSLEYNPKIKDAVLIAVKKQ